MREFSDLASFAAHFATLHHHIQEEAERALKKAALLIEKSAKVELGYYQPGVGPYPAWAQLAQSTLATHALYGVGDTPLMLTGALYASIEHEIQGPTAIIGTKSEIGAYQEFGTARIPPRPFMGPAVYTNIDKIKAIFRRGLVSGLMGGKGQISAAADV